MAGSSAESVVARRPRAATAAGALVMWPLAAGVPTARSSAIDAARRAIRQRTAKANQRAFSDDHRHTSISSSCPLARKTTQADDENPPTQSQPLRDRPGPALFNLEFIPISRGSELVEFSFSNARTLDADRFSAVVSGASVVPGTAEDMASSLMDVITGACDVSMTKANPLRRREPVYWWTAGIADLRRSCLRARRLFQRSRGQQDEEAHSANYASARRLLHAAIKTSKRRC
uniref:Uncharacterized protein n=1 Tax=Trichogramma kaykai TaxID=54128 RepID=A0ABD2WD57_9HYME